MKWTLNILELKILKAFLRKGLDRKMRSSFLSTFLLLEVFMKTWIVINLLVYLTVFVCIFWANDAKMFWSYVIGGWHVLKIQIIEKFSIPNESHPVAVKMSTILVSTIQMTCTFLIWVQIIPNCTKGGNQGNTVSGNN